MITLSKEVVFGVNILKKRLKNKTFYYNQFINILINYRYIAHDNSLREVKKNKFLLCTEFYNKNYKIKIDFDIVDDNLPYEGLSCFILKVTKIRKYKEC